MSWVAVGVTAGAGLAKAELVDAPKEARQRKLAAETQRYSPWTGLQAGQVQDADPMGSVIQGGLTGASFRQNMELSDAKKKLLNSAAAKGAPAATDIQVAGMTAPDGASTGPMDPRAGAPAQSPWLRMGSGGYSF